LAQTNIGGVVTFRRCNDRDLGTSPAARVKYYTVPRQAEGATPTFLLQRMSPVVAQSGPKPMSAFPPLLGDKRTSVGSTKPIYECTA